MPLLKKLVGNHAIWAALVGVVSATVSASLVVPSLDMSGAVRDALGLVRDIFPLSLPLAISAGCAFAVLGGLYLAIALRARIALCLAFALSSILGMFLAAETATWAFVAVDGVSTGLFVAAYAPASIVGALVLIVPTAWLAGRTGFRGVVGRGTTFATVWAIGLALVMTAASGEPLEMPWILALFAGWQSIALSYLARHIERNRPSPQPSDYSQS